MEGPGDMEGGPENANAAALQHVQELQAIHRQQRIQLEADLESNQFQASYPKQLIGLMEREENILAKGGEIGNLSQRVEAALAAETRKLFKLRGQQGEERWRELFHRQRQHRAALELQIQEQPHYSEVSPPTAALDNGEVQKINEQRPKASVSAREDVPEDIEKSSLYFSAGKKNQQQAMQGGGFAAREAVMRADSASRWAEDELFNLNNAFGLQRKRLEADWAAHEARVGEEYHARRAALQARANMNGSPGGGIFQTGVSGRYGQGISPVSLRNIGGDGGRQAGGFDGGVTGGGEGERRADDSMTASLTPWRSREKQSRLIHTAPVFQPDSTGMSSAGAPSCRNAELGPRGFGGDGINVGGIGRIKGALLSRGARKELERLDAAFYSVGDQVEAQKQAAQKWLRRQRIRMEAQIEATRDEREARQQQLSAAEKEERLLVAAVLDGVQ